MNRPEKSELAAQLSLAIPLAAQQMGLMLLGLVDTAILGHYDRDALAGGGVASSMIFLVSCVGMGIVMGLDTLLPQALGAGRHGDTRWLLRDGLRVAIVVGLGLSMVVAASPLLLPAIGVDHGVATQASRFVWVRSVGVALFLCQVTLRVFLQAHGVTAPLILAVVIGNLINAGLDWILVFGEPRIGLPPLGVVGAALATNFVQLLTVGIYALAARALLAEIPRTPRPPPATRRILRLGLPVGLQLCAEVGAFALANLLAARIGQLPAAGHQVAINLASFTFAMALGIGSAAAVRVGLAVGAGDHREARARGVTSLAVGAVMMSTGAIAFLLFPARLAGLFTDDPAVIAAAVPMLRVAAVFQISDGAQAIAAGALRGVGDNRAAFVANLIGHYAVGLGISLVCAFGLGMGAVGLWWGLSAGLTATAIGLLIRFRRITARPIQTA